MYGKATYQELAGRDSFFDVEGYLCLLFRGKREFQQQRVASARGPKSHTRKPIPHHLGFMGCKKHGSFRKSPQFFTSPPSGHNPADRMKIRSQQQVTDFMGKYMAQQCMRKSPVFSHWLDPVIKGIPVVTHSFPVQRSSAEHIGTIPHLRAHRARKDLQHQVSGTNNVAARRLNILSSLGAVPPKRLYSSLLKNPAYLHLRSGQEFCRNVGVVVDRDMDFRRESLCCRWILSQARGGQKAERQDRMNADVIVHSVTSGATLRSANSYLNALWATSRASVDDELNRLIPVAYGGK